MLHHCVWFHPKPFAYYCCCVVWIWIKVWFCGGRETSVLFSFFLLGGGGSSDNGKICRFHWHNFLTYCKYVGTGRQAGGKVMLMLKIHIYYIFNMLCSMFLLSVLELVAAPARTQLAMTFLECLSSSSVTLNLLHMHIQYLKTSKL